MTDAKLIREALKSNTFNVYMKVSENSQGTYRVTGARLKNGKLQVKTIVAGGRQMWWTFSRGMQIYQQ